MRDATSKMIGGLIHHPEYTADVLGLVKPEQLPDPDLAQIFEQVLALQADGLLVTAELLLQREPDQSSGNYVATVIDVCELYIAQPVAYAQFVEREIRRAKVVELARSLGEAAESGDFDDAMTEIAGQVNACTVPASKPVDVTTELPAWRNRLEQPRKGIQTGFASLDRRLSALGAGELSVLAGRPGMGKSALALDIARAQAEPVLFFSLEMSSDELIARAMSAEARVNSRSFRNRNFTEAEVVRINRAQEQWSGNLHIVDDPSTTVEQIDALAAKYQPALIVVDYLQLMVSQGENRNQQIGHLSRSLKRISKARQCHVMALSQLNRGVESRNDKRPTMSDLRDSGEVEQDADQILLLYRHGYYHENFAAYMMAEVDVAKFRQGEAGREYLEFLGQYTTFQEPEDLALGQYKAELAAMSKPSKGFVPRETLP